MAILQTSWLDRVRAEPQSPRATLCLLCRERFYLYFRATGKNGGIMLCFAAAPRRFLRDTLTRIFGIVLYLRSVTQSLLCTTRLWRWHVA